jgi:hypothetical protein
MHYKRIYFYLIRSQIYKFVECDASHEFVSLSFNDGKQYISFFKDILCGLCGNALGVRPYHFYSKRACQYKVCTDCGEQKIKDSVGQTKSTREKRMKSV